MEIMKFAYGTEKQFPMIHSRLQAAIRMLAGALWALYGYTLTLTCLIEERPGFHHPKKAQAADIRTKDMPEDVFRGAMRILTVLRQLSAAPGGDKEKHPQFEWCFEKDEFGEDKDGKQTQTKWQHFHVELDDGKPIK